MKWVLVAVGATVGWWLAGLYVFVTLERLQQRIGMPPPRRSAHHVLVWAWPVCAAVIVYLKLLEWAEQWHTRRGQDGQHH